MLPRLAWSLAALTLALVVADVLVSAQSVSLASETAVAVHGFPFVHGAVLGSAVMGAVIVARYERHPIGWLLGLVGVTSAVSLLTEAYAYWVQEADGPGPEVLGGVAAWASWLFGGQLAIAGIALMFLLAPDGHLVSRRWRPAVWLTGLGALMCLGAVLSMDPATFRLETQEDVVGPVRRALLTGGFLLISAGLVASLVSMVGRLRRSRGEQRQQLRLIALAAGLVALGILNLLVVQSLNGGSQTWLAGVPLFVAYFLMPMLFAVAVLRYRLYDIEVVINRTVVIAAGSAFAAVGYTTIVVTVGRVVDERTGGFWLSLLATALVAVAFQPLRRRVVRLANRLAYGSRAQPYEELSEFSRRLAETPSADTLLPTVAAAAGEALAARSATATLSVPGTDPVRATWGEPSSGATDTHAVPVVGEGGVLGSVEVAIPRGRKLRAADERLLRSLADQAAVAFRNVAMQAQLAGHVAELDRATGELAGSRARVIEADDAARRALEEAISRDVLPHLVVVADGLPPADAPGHDAPVQDAAAVEELVASVNAALEALRELTRGVFPTQLARAGVEPALRSFLARTDASTVLSVDPAVTGARFPDRVEAAVYFGATRAAASQPPPDAIELTVDGSDLLLTVRGIGVGQVDLQGIVDRVEAAGGSVAEAGRALVLRVPAGAGRADLVASGQPGL
ncbi:GAF domain-containing protein [Nocardioides sp. MAHUQ-72]|uniref:GAF domain-containing protein n=1 Tax=unclassified Nocardioides TaxID=2615069 RepID=UPI00361429F9